jgi:MoaA/NifB/PqqE/SkfB family radical SAM enzyme
VGKEINYVTDLLSWLVPGLRCHYCNSPNLNVPELETDQVLRAIDDFYALGTRYITFSGGEPLLRKDLAQIVNYAQDKGIVVFVSTNKVKGTDHETFLLSHLVSGLGMFRSLSLLLMMM